MSFTVTVTFNLFGLKRYNDVINTAVKSGGPNNPIRQVIEKWGVRYRSFIQRRFDRYSKGGGDWKPLVSRVGGTILRDTNTLFMAVQPAFVNQPGAIQKNINGGIEVGYGGTAKHPRANMSIVKLADIHQKGKGNNPSRVIIVPPSERVRTQMVNDMEIGLDRLAKQTVNRPG